MTTGGKNTIFHLRTCYLLHRCVKISNHLLNFAVDISTILSEPLSFLA